MLRGLEALRHFGQRKEIEEIVLPPSSAETQEVIRRMQGKYASYEITGKSSTRTKISYLHPSLKDESAEPVILAIAKDPSAFFLPGSKSISYEDQVDRIPAEQAKIDEEYPGAGLVVRLATVPEWIEVAGMCPRDQHPLDKDYTWTATDGSAKSKGLRAVFSWGNSNGVQIRLWTPDLIAPHVGLALVIEIPRR